MAVVVVVGGIPLWLMRRVLNRFGNGTNRVAAVAVAGCRCCCAVPVMVVVLGLVGEDWRLDCTLVPLLSNLLLASLSSSLLALIPSSFCCGLCFRD